jgi:hypothetical protein
MNDQEEGFGDGAYGEGGFDAEQVVDDDAFIDDEQFIGAGYDDQDGEDE